MVATLLGPSFDGRVLRSPRYATVIKLFSRISLLGLTCLGSRPAESAMASLAVRNNSVFCVALSTIGAGEGVPLAVTGVYEVSPESRAFFNPADPTCEGRVQPATWVEFATAGESNAELGRLLESSQRAWVTFEGILEGPGLVAPDDPSVPFAAALSARKANRRYGHMNLFRTRLIVNAVRDVRAVSEDVPWQWGGRPQSSSAGRPIPLQMSRLAYPEVAKELGISGEVKLEVSVTNGEIQQAKLLSGDRVLGLEAERWIRTLRFSSDVSVKFTTLIVYTLERRDPGDEGDRVLLELPLRAEIRGAQLAW